MGLIDTHTHLESFVRKDTIGPALARAREAGLEALITIGTSPDDWSAYRNLAQDQPGFVHYSVGLHPCSVDAGWKDAVDQIDAFWGGAAAKPVALGECGLDRFHLPKDAEKAREIFAFQRSAFSAQLTVA